MRVAQGFTRDRRALIDSVSKLEAAGGTALYDSVLEALALLEGSGNHRQLLVLFSDGMDLDTAARFSELEKHLESSTVVVYAVGLYAPEARSRYLRAGAYLKKPALDENLNPAWILERVAERSGGVAFFPREVTELLPLFHGIAREIALHYPLAYVPSLSSGPPRFRAIEVRASDPAHPDAFFRVRARKGYVR